MRSVQLDAVAVGLLWAGYASGCESSLTVGDPPFLHGSVEEAADGLTLRYRELERFIKGCRVRQSGFKARNGYVSNHCEYLHGKTMSGVK